MERVLKVSPLSSALMIAFTSFKGGVGKTTDSVALACELGRRGYRVELLDFDPQASATQNHSKTPEGMEPMPFGVRNLAIQAKENWRALRPQLEELSRTRDFLILDTPGNMDSQGVYVALQLADLLVIPMRPKEYEVQTSVETLQKIDERVLPSAPNLQIRLLRAMVERTKINSMLEAKIAAVAEQYKAPMLNTIIRSSVGFAEMAATGLPLWELPGGRRAADDMVALADELLGTLGVATPAEASTAPTHAAGVATGEPA